MARRPLTFLEQRWAAGWANNNSLVKAATQNTDRIQVPNLDYDTHRNITALGRRTLMSIGRYLYWNCTPVRGAVDEIARLSVSTFIPQFIGEDQAWGEQAEKFLLESDKFIDVRGFPYNMPLLKQNLVREVIIDGDFGILLTEMEGMAKLQTWRAHRIGSRTTVNAVVGGRYDGARLIDGVVVNEIGRALAYGIIDENGWNTEPKEFVSANDFLLCFLPNFSDQVRGISLLGASAFDWQDVNESRAFELIAQKIGATFAMQILNESGEPDRAKALLRAPATAADSDGNAQSLPQEIIKPGRTMYFRAGTGQRLEPVKNDRPSNMAMAFQEEIIRGGLESIGWSFDFSHNPTKAGGAQMRIVVDKINARLAEIRRLLVEPVCRRVDSWRVAKAIKAGVLPPNEEWWRWTYQGPRRQTADRGHDSRIDLDETARGLMSESKAIAERGDFYRDVYAQKEAETRMKWDAAARIAQQFGVSVEAAYASLWMPTPNGNMASSGAAQQQGQQQPQSNRREEEEEPEQ